MLQQHLLGESTSAYKLSNDEYNKFKSTYGFADDSRASYTGNTYVFSTHVSKPDATTGFDLTLNEREWTNPSDGKVYRVYYAYRQGSWGSDEYYLKSLRCVSGNDTAKDYDYSPAQILQPTIASWYLALRNIALVALLSILVYIGIRITLTSVAGDKAKYKQMLIDWVVALALVFLMHYIMSFAVTINELIIQSVNSITVSGYGNEIDVVGEDSSYTKTEESSFSEVDNYAEEGDIADKMDAAGVQLFIIEEQGAVDRAYKTLVDDGKTNAEGKGKDSSFYNRFKLGDDGKPIALYWPANDFMEQARMLGQDIGDDINQTKVARAGYNIIYVVLVIYTIMFCFTYLKRVIYMAFLTLMAPLVAITYPIDKISDGKAQAFDMWIKEYIFNLLMQPMHLILYTILVGMAMKFAATNIFYAVVAIGFLMPAEKILRRFFRFERAQTPGMFEGAAGAALMMQGLNRLMHRSSSKSKLGSGNGKDSGEENPKISTYKNGEDPLDGIGEGRGEDPERPIRTNDNNEDNSGEEDANNQESGQNPNRTLNTPNTNVTNENNNSTENTNNNGNNSGNNTQNEGERKKIHFKRARRAIRRGVSNYGKGIQRRYIMNKKRNGGLIRRGFKLAGGVATAATMAAAGGIIGITSGDASKAAQYMAAGAAGGYALGKSGVDKVSGKLSEQFKDPLHQAKVGFYGEEEYQRREHEKFKKREFEQNTENIQKLQEKYDLDWKSAKEKAKQISRYTDSDGINSFNHAYAVDRLMKDGFSESEALSIGKLVNGSLNGQGADKMKREDRQQMVQDLRDKLMQRGMNSSEATREASRMIGATNKFAKYAK